MLDGIALYDIFVRVEHFSFSAPHRDSVIIQAYSPLMRWCNSLNQYIVGCAHYWWELMLLPCNTDLCGRYTTIIFPHTLTLISNVSHDPPLSFSTWYGKCSSFQSKFWVMVCPTSPFPRSEFNVCNINLIEWHMYSNGIFNAYFAYLKSITQLVCCSTTIRHFHEMNKQKTLWYVRYSHKLITW